MKKNDDKPTGSNSPINPRLAALKSGSGKSTEAMPFFNSKTPPASRKKIETDPQAIEEKATSPTSDQPARPKDDPKTLLKKATTAEIQGVSPGTLRNAFDNTLSDSSHASSTENSDAEDSENASDNHRKGLSGSR